MVESPSQMDRHRAGYNTQDAEDGFERNLFHVAQKYLGADQSPDGIAGCDGRHHDHSSEAQGGHDEQDGQGFKYPGAKKSRARSAVPFKPLLARRDLPIDEKAGQRYNTHESGKK